MSVPGRSTSAVTTSLACLSPHGAMAMPFQVYVPSVSFVGCIMPYISALLFLFFSLLFLACPVLLLVWQSFPFSGDCGW